MGQRDSKFDPLRPAVSGIEGCTPYYEDRILLKWAPPPAQPGLVEVPTRPSNRDTGPQHGVVVAVGAGVTGFSKIRPKLLVTGKKEPENVLVPFKGQRKHREPTVKPGDLVLYSRDPANEFEENGELYTFVFEEQSVLCVLDQPNAA